MIRGLGVGRYGLEILRVSLGSELHVCRQLDVDRMVEEVMRELRGKKLIP